MIYNAGIAALQIGQNSNQAYRGDRGKIAYDHANANGSSYSKNLYKIQTNAEGHVTSATTVSKSDITALGIPSSNTTYTLSTTTGTFTTAAAVTIAANGSGTLNFTNGTAPSGYTAIGLRRVNVGSINLPIVDFNITGSVAVRNVTSSSITIAKNSGAMIKQYIKLTAS